MWQITCYRGSAVITALVLSLLATSAYAVPTFFARSEITATVSSNPAVAVSTFSDLIPCGGGCTSGGATGAFSQFPPPGNARTWFAETDYLGGAASAAGLIDAEGSLTLQNNSSAATSVSVVFDIALTAIATRQAFSEASFAEAIADILIFEFDAAGTEIGFDPGPRGDVFAGLEFDIDGLGTASATDGFSYTVVLDLVAGGSATFDILASVFGQAEDEDPNPPVDVPEPSTLGLLAAGLVGLVATRRRRQVP